jgi:hypothetical protein
LEGSGIASVAGRLEQGNREMAIARRVDNKVVLMVVLGTIEVAKGVDLNL